MSDYHRILGLPRDANLDEIRRAFWQLARRYRDELGDPTGQMRLEQIRRAYHALSSDVGRSRGRKVLGQGRAEPVTGRVPWFGDEVAVDFPSVAGFVERMQEGFFGTRGHADALATDVSLTAREAARGATIDVSVPLCQTCPVCGGRGEVWTERCGICTGRGGALVPHQIQVAVPRGVRHGTRLRYRVVLPYVPSTVLDIRFTVR